MRWLILYVSVLLVGAAFVWAQMPAVNSALPGSNGQCFYRNSGAFGAKACTADLLSGLTGSIGGAIVGIGCDSGTATVTGATTAMVAVAEATDYPGDGIFWKARVTNTDEVTVYVCSDVTVTPTASTYKVRVIP